jgi:ATP-dependent DNA ligase
VSPSGKVRIWSRQRKAPTPHFPEIVGAPSVVPRGVRLDGELVVPRNGGVDFAALQQRIHPAANVCRIHATAATIPARDQLGA